MILIKKSISYFFLALVILFSSCKTPSKILKNAEVEEGQCQDVLLELQKKIFPLKNGEFYGVRFDSDKAEERKKEYSDLALKVNFSLSKKSSCFGSLKENDIVSLFGTPPNPHGLKSYQEVNYFFDVRDACPCVSCTGWQRYGECDLLRFSFDKSTGYLQSVEFIASNVGWNLDY